MSDDEVMYANLRAVIASAKRVAMTAEKLAIASESPQFIEKLLSWVFLTPHEQWAMGNLEI